MPKDTITAHIKLEDDQWQRLGSIAQNEDMTAARLVRHILDGWLDSQVIVRTDAAGPWTAQQLGEHSGYNPSPWKTRQEYLDCQGTPDTENTMQVSGCNDQPSFFKSMPVGSIWRYGLAGDWDGDDYVVVAHDDDRVIWRPVNDTGSPVGPHNSLRFGYYGVTQREYDTWIKKMRHRVFPGDTVPRPRGFFYHGSEAHKKFHDEHCSIPCWPHDGSCEPVINSNHGHHD